MLRPDSTFFGKPSPDPYPNSTPDPDPQPCCDVAGGCKEKSLVLILDGISEIHAHIKSLLCDLLKALDYIESSHKSDFFSKNTFFPSCVRNMI